MFQLLLKKKMFVESCRPIIGTVGCNAGWVGVSIVYRHTLVSYIGGLNPRVSFKGPKWPQIAMIHFFWGHAVVPST